MTCRHDTWPSWCTRHRTNQCTPSILEEDTCSLEGALDGRACYAYVCCLNQDGALCGCADGAAVRCLDCLDGRAYLGLTYAGQAREALDALLIAAGQTGGLVAVQDAARELGVDWSGLGRKLARLGVPTVDAPRNGYGPRFGRYIRRSDLAKLRTS
jgi:hypothetical protein